MRAVRTVPLLATLCLAVAGPALAAQAARQQATVNGFAPDRLTRIDSALQRYVDDNRVAGAVAIVMRDGKVVYEKAIGWSDREANRRMTTDAIFRIASQSKAITSVAALMLVEDGKVNLSDPISRWIPSFAKTTVAVRRDSTKPASDSNRVIVPARRQITVRDLLTHTSGMSYGGEPMIIRLYDEKHLGYGGNAYGWYTADKDEPICDTMERLGTLPFVAQPGTAWVYGYNLDVLGCVIERASGKPLDEFIRERITKPLGLNDTYFFLPKDKRSRLAAVYTPDESGRVSRAPNGPKGQGDYVDGPRRNFAGGAGLLSTARDYARFLEMLRNDGALDGHRYLAPHTVAMMRTNQVGTLHAADGGLGFGLGFETTERYGANGLSSVGTFSWGGAYGSTYKVDPKERLVMCLMVQVVPSVSGGIKEAFDTAVYQALVGN
jgi:CubicO group peptidase (beta-lactamase class C family)